MPRELRCSTIYFRSARLVSLLNVSATCSVFLFRTLSPHFCSKVAQDASFPDASAPAGAFPGSTQFILTVVGGPERPKLDVVAADGDVIEEDIAIRMPARRCHGLIEQELATGVGAAHHE